MFYAFITRLRVYLSFKYFRSVTVRMDAERWTHVGYLRVKDEVKIMLFLLFRASM